jgi:hypothetical protein
MRGEFNDGDFNSRRKKRIIKFSKNFHYFFQIIIYLFKISSYSFNS